MKNDAGRLIRFGREAIAPGAQRSTLPAVLCLVVSWGAIVAAQPGLLGSKPPDRVTLTAAAEPAQRPHQGWTVRLSVAPLPGIHLYTPANDGYTGVSLTLHVPDGLRAGKADYPPGDPFVFGALKELVQVYDKPFTITQPVLATDARALRRPVSVRGTVRFQACTDRVCFAPQEQSFDVQLRPSAAKSSSRSGM